MGKNIYPVFLKNRARIPPVLFSFPAGMEAEVECGVTAVTQGDGGEACGEMKDAVNLRAAAFHSRICARLNFPRGGRQEAAGPSVTL